MAIKKLELATDALLTVSIDIERAVPGLKFHPMGTGSAFKTNGLFATIGEVEQKALLRYLGKNKWRTSVLNKAKTTRKDGKWYVGPMSVGSHGYSTPHLFMSHPGSKGIIDVLLQIQLTKV